MERQKDLLQHTEELGYTPKDTCPMLFPIHQWKHFAHLKQVHTLLKWIKLLPYPTWMSSIVVKQSLLRIQNCQLWNSFLKKEWQC